MSLIDRVDDDDLLSTWERYNWMAMCDGDGNLKIFFQREKKFQSKFSASTSFFSAVIPKKI